MNNSCHPHRLNKREHSKKQNHWNRLSESTKIHRETSLLLINRFLTIIICPRKRAQRLKATRISEKISMRPRSSKAFSIIVFQSFRCILQQLLSALTPIRRSKGSVELHLTRLTQHRRLKDKSQCRFQPIKMSIWVRTAARSALFYLIDVATSKNSTKRRKWIYGKRLA